MSNALGFAAMVLGGFAIAAESMLASAGLGLAAVGFVFGAWITAPR